MRHTRRVWYAVVCRGMPRYAAVCRSMREKQRDCRAELRDGLYNHMERFKSGAVILQNPTVFFKIEFLSGDSIVPPLHARPVNLGI